MIIFIMVNTNLNIGKDECFWMQKFTTDLPTSLVDVEYKKILPKISRKD